MILKEQLEILEKDHDFSDGYQCSKCEMKKSYFEAWKRGLLRLEKDGESASENHYKLMKCSERQKRMPN